MPMLKANQITPRQFRNVVPDIFKNRGYITLEKDMSVEIESIVFSIYQATKTVGDEKQELTTKDGTPITNITAYIGFTDGFYSSVNGDIAVQQLASIVGFDETAIGQYPYKLDTPEKVKTITVNEKMGNKDYPKIAFD